MPKTAHPDVHDPYGRTIPTSVATPAAVAPAAERVRTVVAHHLAVWAETNRLSKAVENAPNEDARAAVEDPAAPRTLPALQAELSDSQAALLAADQAVKSARREQHAAIVAAAPEWLDDLLEGVNEDRDAILEAIDQLDAAFRALAQRERLIALIQQIQNGDNVWEWHPVEFDRVADKECSKAAEWIEATATSIGGLPHNLKEKPKLLEALRWHARFVAGGRNPEAVRARLLRPEAA